MEGSSHGIESNAVIEECTENISRKFSGMSMAQSQPTIYRVHTHLKNVNIKAYEPEVVAIGPYHRDNASLKMMEDHKLRYFRSLLRRQNANVKKIVAAIEPLEPEARMCYSEHISLTAAEFTEMLVLDGCFILELVQKCNNQRLREEKDMIFHMDWIMHSLQRDLMLFENQLPFFILSKLFELIEAPGEPHRLTYLLLNFFNGLFPARVNLSYHRGERYSNITQEDIKHLLDLVHNNWNPASNPLLYGRMSIPGSTRMRSISPATELAEANVKFEPIVGDEVSLFDVRFKNGTIFLAPLTVEDRTEALFRNLVAYEQYFVDGNRAYVTDYVNLLDCLIDSSKDVAILCRDGIIDNVLGDEKDVANLVNKLTDSIPRNTWFRLAYGLVFLDVNDHCSRRTNRWMATLRREYLNTPWAVTSILFAVTLLLVTVVQAVTSVLQLLRTP